MDSHAPAGHFALQSGLRFDPATRGLHLADPGAVGVDVPDARRRMNDTARGAAQPVARRLRARGTGVPSRRYCVGTHGRPPHRGDHDRQWRRHPPPRPMTRRIPHALRPPCPPSRCLLAGRVRPAARRVRRQGRTGRAQPRWLHADPLPTPRRRARFGDRHAGRAGPGPGGDRRQRGAAEELATDESTRKRGWTKTPTAQIDADAPNPSANPPRSDAVEVIEQYYSAIEERDFARPMPCGATAAARAGRSPDQFAAGFANTADSRRDARCAGARGRRGGLALHRSAGGAWKPPAPTAACVATSARTRCGVRWSTARRDEQRAWRIASADLRELAQ